MVTVKMLKPYYIKADGNLVRIVLAYQYFSVVINNKIYQFIPVEAREIRMNRKTMEVDNVEARFAFQKGKDIIYMTMTELISLPDFLAHLHSIIEPYIKMDEQLDSISLFNEMIIAELERLNIKRLIDKALDEHDEASFHQLARLL